MIPLIDLIARYDWVTEGPVFVSLDDYTELTFSFGHWLTHGPYLGSHGGVLFLGREFLPATRSLRMNLKLTEHARERAKQMGVPTKKIKHILRNAEVDCPSGRGDGYRVAVVDNIAVPYSVDGHAITVLWRGELDRDAPGQGLRVGS